MFGSEDCGFLAGGDADGGFLMTDDFVAFGNEDAYVAFSEDSVVFGSTSTGSNFTIDADVTETDDEGIMMTYDEGSTTFTADDTVVLATSDPDADTLTINNPVYNYTDDAFIISGDIEGCTLTLCSSPFSFVVVSFISLITVVCHHFFLSSFSFSRLHSR